MFSAARTAGDAMLHYSSLNSVLRTAGDSITEWVLIKFLSRYHLTG
jgi:hypothetical protein